jgi:predicted DNA-binding ribbon-helix-helix protein
MTQTRLVSCNVSVPTGRTGMRLEPELWSAAKKICAREDIDLGGLIRRAQDAYPGGMRTSAVRVLVINYFRTAAGATTRQ